MRNYFISGCFGFTSFVSIRISKLESELKEIGIFFHNRKIVSKLSKTVSKTRKTKKWRKYRVLVKIPITFNTIFEVFEALTRLG